MSHEETLPESARCSIIGALCRAIDAIKAQDDYPQQMDDIEDLTRILECQGFSLVYYPTPIRNVNRYLVKAGWNHVKFKNVKGDVVLTRKLTKEK